MKFSTPTLIWRILICLCIGFTNFLPVTAAPSLDTVSEVKSATVSLRGSIPIPELIYGINNLWKEVPQNEFEQFAAAMSEHLHYSMIRFPGGWVAENYDWSSNRTPGWKKAPEQPGVDPRTLTLKTPAQTFVVRTSPAMKENTDDARRELALEAANLVKLYGNKVKIWEIGNEWWLQGFADGNKRAEGLRRYAKAVASIAPAMKAANSSVDLYINGDWKQPEEFGQLKSLVGKNAWAKVDGFSVHLYCGQKDEDTHISSIRPRLNQIKTLTGKDKIYASEWNVSLRASGLGGLRNANMQVLAIQEMVFGGVSVAAIWPPVRVLPRLSLVSSDYSHALAPGQGFDWMAQGYQGKALKTSGQIPLIAAKNNSGRIVVIVPSMGESTNRIQIQMPDIEWKSVISSEVMYDQDDPDQGSAKITELPVKVGAVGNTRTIEFTLNPGGTKRGISWEIARIVLE